MKSNITGKASITIKATTAKVWEALTTPAIIKKYFFGTDAVFDWQVGSPLIFKVEYNGKHYADKGTILEIVPLQLFKYNYWSSMWGLEDKPENYVDVTYEILGQDNDVTLIVTQENIPDEKMKGHPEQNWNKVLGDLKELLEGG